MIARYVRRHALALAYLGVMASLWFVNPPTLR